MGRDLILAPLWSVYVTQMINQIELNDLSNYTKDELLNLWQKLSTRDKPPTAVKVLIRELAYRLQEQEFGKLDKNTTVSLRRHMTSFSNSLTSGTGARSPKTPPQTVLETGAIIRKNWQGQECVIKVLGKRIFEYNKQTFKSLSAVATAITGQHVSGPLFFDLKK